MEPVNSKHSISARGHAPLASPEGTLAGEAWSDYPCKFENSFCNVSDILHSFPHSDPGSVGHSLSITISPLRLLLASLEFPIYPISPPNEGLKLE